MLVCDIARYGNDINDVVEYLRLVVFFCTTVVLLTSFVVVAMVKPNFSHPAVTVTSPPALKLVVFVKVPVLPSCPALI